MSKHFQSVNTHTLCPPRTYYITYSGRSELHHPKGTTRLPSPTTGLRQHHLFSVWCLLRCLAMSGRNEKRFSLGDKCSERASPAPRRLDRESSEYVRGGEEEEMGDNHPGIPTDTMLHEPYSPGSHLGCKHRLGDGTERRIHRSVFTIKMAAMRSRCMKTMKSPQILRSPPKRGKQSRIICLGPSY